MANKNGLSEIEWMLEGNSADTYTSNENLIGATQKGDFLRVTELLSPKEDGSTRDDVDISESDSEGRSAIYYAANGQLKIAEKLLEHGANPNSRDQYQATPLHKAAQGHTKVITLLVEKGADLNAENEWGYTPLHEAALGGHQKCVEALLLSKADVNSQNEHGESPLHFACQKGHEKIVQTLLSFKAAKNLMNMARKLPIDKARERGYDAIVKLVDDPTTIRSVEEVEQNAESMFDYLEEAEFVEESKNIKMMVTTPSMRVIKAKDHDEYKGKPKKQKNHDATHGALLVPARQMKKKPKQLTAGLPRSYSRLYESDVWELCRQILQDESVRDWSMVRGKLKKQISKEQWTALKDSRELANMKRRCRKYFDGESTLEKVRKPTDAPKVRKSHSSPNSSSPKRGNKKFSQKRRKSGDGISINLSKAYENTNGIPPARERKKSLKKIKSLQRKRSKKKNEMSPENLQKFEKLVHMVENEETSENARGRESDNDGGGARVRSSSENRRPHHSHSKTVRKRRSRKKVASEKKHRSKSEKRKSKKRDKVFLMDVINDSLIKSGGHT